MKRIWKIKGKCLKRRRLLIVLGFWLGIWLWMGAGTGLKLYAAEGTVFFGSEAYAWNAGEVSPIGVYISSAAPIKSYSICVEYDASKLTYLNGADRVEGNLIYLEGSGEASEYKRMLHFEPIAAGETQLRIASAAGIAMIAHEDGSITEEEITVASFSQVPVSMRERVSGRLKQLTVTGAEGMEAFDSQRVEYHFQVDYQTQRLELQYEAEDEKAVVEISDDTLRVGSNVVTLRVQSGDAEPVIYILYAERRAPQEGEAAEASGADGLEGEKQAEADKVAGVAQDVTSDSVPESGTAGAESIQTDSQSGVEHETAGEIKARADDVKETELTEEVELSPVLGITAAFVGLSALVYGAVRIRERKRGRGQETDNEAAEEDIKFINMEQTVIQIEHVTMRFRQAQDEAASLKEYLIRVIKRQNRYRMLTALNDISIEIKQGDVVGIIGTNGSGKSTLLKIIAGALHPTEGEVIVDRSKVQMLTLGTGFDMELTAKENVYLNGAIIGYSKEYIDERYDDIVSFAELEGFMDERMKNFSSGMVSRLGFAIATMRNTPDILILDEVLSVGDMFFRRKSEKRIKEMIHSGATVLIVSHSADVIRKNCDKAVWIEKGELRMTGAPEEVCRAYEGMAAGA